MKNLTNIQPSLEFEYQMLRNYKGVPVGVWLLPSWKRPHKIEEFIRQAAIAGMSTPCVVLLDDDDPSKDEYLKIKLPHDWQFFMSKVTNEDRVNCIGRKIRDWTRQRPEFFKNAEWIGFLTDNYFPVTLRWDMKLIDQLNGMNFISSNDRWMAPMRVTGATVFSGDFLRAIGYIYPPKLNHNYIDNIWETLGKRTGLWECDMSTIVLHKHWLQNTAQKDEAAINSWAFMKEDLNIFLEWHSKEFPLATQRLKQMMKEKMRLK